MRQSKIKLRELGFNSDTDFGNYFPPVREGNHDQKVDLILDSVTMADHTPKNLKMNPDSDATMQPERYVIVGKY